MVPAYEDGDLVITRPFKTLRLHDVVMFQEPVHEIFIIHRIIRVDRNYVITKGDTNREPDPLTLAKAQINGKVCMKIPKIGSFIRLIQRRRQKCQRK
jgi:signal peptidase I